MITLLRSILRLLCSFVLLIGCSSEVDFEKKNPDLYPSGDLVELFKIPYNNSGEKVDILIVDDNSGSMEVEQSKMGSRLDSFLAGLGDVDWQIGITTTDVSNGRHGIKGSLVDLEGAPGKILTKHSPSPRQVFKDTVSRSETYQCSRTATCPSGLEQPFNAIVSAIDKRDSDNSGLFREGASLAVIILTDEDESGSVSEDDVIRKVASTFGANKKFSVYGIILESGDYSCLGLQRLEPGGGDSKYSVQVENLALRTGGITGSICDSDYGPTLQSIGQRVVDLIGSVVLRYEPKPESLVINVEPKQNVQWVVNGNKISFNPGLLPGSTVQVEYSYGHLD